MAQQAVSSAQASFSLAGYLFGFSGRILRWQYWVGQIGLAVLVTIIEAIAGRRSVVTMLAYLLALWPSFAIAAKRWHDRAKSGWWSVIMLIPFVGLLWVLIELGFLRGDPGTNRYGEPPR